MNPPGHHPDAKDFVAVNGKGDPYKAHKIIRHMFYKLSVEDTFAWEQEVLSPFEGEIVVANDGAKDRKNLNFLRDLFDGLFFGPRRGKGDINYFLGNHIIIKSSDGIYALLAHLREGSLRVKNGDYVMSGDVLAKVGNSGNSIQPHLHFQIMKEQDPAQGTPIPFLFDYRIPGKEESKSINLTNLPKNYQHFRV